MATITNTLTCGQVHDLRTTREAALKALAVDPSRISTVAVEGDSYRCTWYSTGECRVGSTMLNKTEIDAFLGI